MRSLRMAVLWSLYQWTQDDDLSADDKRWLHMTIYEWGDAHASA